MTSPGLTYNLSPLGEPNIIREAMLAALAESMLPEDATYARAMLALYAANDRALEAHGRMVKAYEDGMNDRAARYAEIARDEFSDIVHGHDTLIAAMAKIEDRVVNNDDRHAANRQGGQLPQAPDPMDFCRVCGEAWSSTQPCGHDQAPRRPVLRGAGANHRGE